MKKKLLFTLMFFTHLVLADTTSYVCNYTNYSNEKGSHAVKDKFELHFMLDKNTDKGYMIGNNGSNEVHVIESKTQITFIEVTVTNNVMTTTINSKMKSVHSRNTVMFGDLIPSQFYGTCALI